MWPFDTKTNSNTQALSGVFEHNDKNHMWGRWEPYDQNVYYPKLSTWGIRRRQKRDCQICGFREDQEIE
jgi:hypothetical protein